VKFESPNTCPKCFARAGFRKLDLEDRATGLGIYLLGGLLAWGFYETFGQNKLVCTHCGYAFRPPSNLSAKKLILISLLLLGLAALLILGIQYLNRY
jgi:hypothetical protein